MSLHYLNTAVEAHSIHSCLTTFLFVWVYGKLSHAPYGEIGMMQLAVHGKMREQYPINRYSTIKLMMYKKGRKSQVLCGSSRLNGIVFWGKLELHATVSFQVPHRTFQTHALRTVFTSTHQATPKALTPAMAAGMSSMWAVPRSHVATSGWCRSCLAGNWKSNTKPVSPEPATQVRPRPKTKERSLGI